MSVDCYNVEIADNGGFVGDKATKGAFWTIIDEWRKLRGKTEKDPLGKKPSARIGKQRLAELLSEGDVRAAAIIASATHDFAHELAAIIRRYLRLKEWRGTECIVIGGGFSASRLGRIAVAQAELLLKAEDIALDLDFIRNDPDEAGLLGAVHLLPRWMLKGHNGMLAVDLGGTNFRVGVVRFGKRSAQVTKARIVKLEHWRHGDESVSRDASVDRLISMIAKLNRWAGRHDIELTPLIGIACPGLIEEDGSIKRGGQNLPGNWESRRFNLPAIIRSRVARIGKDEPLVVMHNDAVVQGLSELSRVRDLRHWGVLTIGTGLGNARYTNREPNGGEK